MPEPTLNVTNITSRIHSLGLNWLARETEVTRLSEAARKLRLGATPPPHARSLEEREKAAATQAHPPAGAAYPAAYDARTAGWVTPVEDQGGCGSCVAFGTTATVEAAVRATYGNRNLGVDLSEAQVFYCYGKAAGATCGSGWWPDGALNGFKEGVVDASCFPYTAGDQSCHLCSNSSDRMTWITNWHLVNSTSAMKSWISSKGPMAACFTVYNDFFAYASGVYSPDVASGVAGGHCVSVVGYNDPGKFWICKNSWGSGWGEQGFFCIAYNVCGLDSEMWAVDGIVDTGWRNNQVVRGVWSIDQNFNAWAYLSDYGWKKISNATDNEFFDMLGQILAAKAAGHAINAHLTSGMIDQIYS